MQAAVAVGIFVTLTSVSSGSASRALSPVEYRSTVESVCRINGVMKTTIQRQIDTAYKAKDWGAYFHSLGSVIGLFLIQDRQLETTPIPETLKTQMAPVMIDLSGLDTHLHRAVKIAGIGDTKAMLVEVGKASPFGARAAGHLKAAGLKYCAAIYSS